MLIWSFFENMRIGSGSISSIVKEKLIVLDEWWIVNILEMPRNGVWFLSFERKLDGLKVILERENVKNLKTLQANQLSVEMRLLHNMISQIFL